MRIQFAAAVASALVFSALSPAKAGVEHERLAALAGTWSVKQSLWLDPGKGPEIDPGTSVIAPVLDNQHFQRTLKINSKAPFAGIGYFGYDIATSQYYSSWMDVSFTGVILSRGGYDAATSTYNFSATVTSEKGETFPLREVMKVADKNHFTYEYYETHSGKETLVVRLEYSR